jgi:outer membrane immunogenic protein
MTKLFAAAVALFAFAGANSAGAADLPAPAPAPPRVYAPPPPPPAFSWSGCFVGAGGGYGVWYENASGQLAGGATVFPTTTLGGSGWFGTGQVGCDYQFDRIVIGVFGDGDFGSASGHLFQGAASDINESYSWAAGGRIGWLPFPKLLTYLSAGFTQAHYDQVNNITGGGVLFNANTYNGYFIGSGYEYGFEFFPGLFWKTEYRFADYQAANLAVLSSLPQLAGAVTLHVQPYIQTVSTELVYRFNWGW